MRTRLCAGASPALARPAVTKGGIPLTVVQALSGMKTVVAESGVTFVSLSARRSMPPSRTHEVVRREDEWRDLSEAKGLVCVQKGELMFIATIGPEPSTREEWSRLANAKLLDRGGRGYVVLDGFGEPTITHNLSGEVEVPKEFQHLFSVNCVAVTRMDLAAENAHWSPQIEAWAEAA